MHGEGGISRRRFMKYGARGLVAAGATGLVSSEALRHSWSAAAAHRGAVRPLLPTPPTIRSRDGRLRARLVCRPAIVDMGAEREVATYTYNGSVPGPTWVVRPGDRLDVSVVNRLPEIDHEHAESIPDRPHEWTTTNLHTHGLHVSPKGNSDNVFLAIPPGERQRYEIEIPEDHPPGVYWYHPHRHGAVAQQVRAGMAGMLIVKGDLDEVPEVRAARERVLVLQTIALGADYKLQDPIPNPSTEEAFFPRRNLLYTVNGVLQPRIRMRPGEVQRWRIVNAADGKFLSLRLDRHDFNVLAWDGMTHAAPQGAEVLMLSAGNRVDLLVKAGEPGTYDLMLTPGSSQKPDIPGMPASAETPEPTTFGCDLPTRGADLAAGSHGHDSGGHAALRDEPPELQPRPVAKIEVVGESRDMALPTALPAFDQPILPIRRRTRFEYTVQRKADNEFISFGIDGKTFDADRSPYRARLGTAEEWTIVNACDPKLEKHAHVFHIHVNPFKITAVNGRRLSSPIWRDTYVLTGRNGDSFTFETNFLDFTGKFVQHCHVLSHEDLGMMAAVEVRR